MDDLMKMFNDRIMELQPKNVTGVEVQFMSSQMPLKILCARKTIIPTVHQSVDILLYTALSTTRERISPHWLL